LIPEALGADEPQTRGRMDGTELRLLFHQLNNQLGVILAHAELLESKAADDAIRVRAAHSPSHHRLERVSIASAVIARNRRLAAPKPHTQNCESCSRM